MVKRFLRSVGDFVRRRTGAPVRDTRPWPMPSPAPRPSPRPEAPRLGRERPRSENEKTAQRPRSKNVDYPGDFVGRPPIEYAPVEGKLPDPGEIVWAWVPFEEDHTRGKERPVLLIGRDDPWLLAVPLTSKDHDRDAAQEARQGRHWIDIGSGDWDRSGRPSEARVNRVVRVDPTAVRRHGVRLDRKKFDAVAGQIRQHTT